MLAFEADDSRDAEPWVELEAERTSESGVSDTGRCGPLLRWLTAGRACLQP